MNRLLSLLVRSSGPLLTAILLIGAAPAPVEGCSKGAFGAAQPDFYFVFTALADTMDAGWPGATREVPGRPRLIEPGDQDTESPRWGQLVRLEEVAGQAADRVPQGAEQLILVPWDYRGDCRALPWQQSARFIPPGQRGFMQAVLRDREDWVDGVPTADLHNPYNLPYPQQTPRTPQNAMSIETVFRVHHVLPRPDDVREDPRGAVAPLLEWARQNPELARQWPATDMLRHSLHNITREEVRRLDVPVAGTYRFVLDLGDGVPRTFYARTSSAPTGPASLESGDDWLREVRAPSYAGYTLWAEGAPRPELLGSTEARGSGGYLYVFPSVDPRGGGVERIPGGAELSLAARALPDDPEVQALNTALREGFGTGEFREYIDRNLTLEADGFFLIHPDEGVTFEQTYHLPGGRVVTLRGVRVEAQGPRQIGSEEACPECSIHLELEVSLGDRDGPGAVGYSVAVARDGADRYYLSHVYDRQGILVFDGDGTFLDRVGRAGEGPGEYAVASLVSVTDGDTVRIFDNGLRRLTVLEPFPDLSVVRTNPIAAPVGGNRTIVADGGSLVTSGHVPTPESAGLPLHRLSSEGELIHSFGAEDPVVAPGQEPALSRVLAWAQGAGEVWVVHPDEYRIEQWTLDGDKAGEWNRTPSWLEPRQEGWVLAPGRPPPTRIQAVAEDGERRLWVLAHVPGEDWESALLEREGPEGPVYEPRDFERLFDTVVEVIDADGRLLVSERLPQYLLTFVEPGLVVGYRETALEMPFLDVYSVELQGR